MSSGCSHEYQILGLYRGWDDKTRCMTFTPLGETLTEQDLRVSKAGKNWAFN